MYRWIVFLHILGAFGFFMAHGASAVMAVRLQKERDLKRIQAILDLSNAALPVMYFSLMLLLLAGIAAGIMGKWFSHGWIWTAIVIMFILFGWMQYYAMNFFTPIRKAVGMPYRQGREEKAAESPLSEAEIDKLIKAANPIPVLTVSFGLIAIILWLMMFKPF